MGGVVHHRSPADPDLWLHSLSSREVTILHHFSARGPVTIHEVDAAVEAFRAQCHNSSLQDAPFCDHVGTYQGELPRELRLQPRPWQRGRGQERSAKRPIPEDPERQGPVVGSPSSPPKSPSLTGALPLQP